MDGNDLLGSPLLAPLVEGFTHNSGMETLVAKQNWVTHSGKLKS
jgi:hypothetical protein